MKDVNDFSNSFETLCVIASQRNFCWKLFCTTCGNSDIRFGFFNIAKGIHPNSVDWNIKRFPYKAMKISNWSEAMEANFINVVSDASLDFISKNCKFPDWLGYLGLILYMFHFDFKNRELLTKSLKPQLDDLVNKRNPENLELIKQIGILSWENLELYEKALY